MKKIILLPIILGSTLLIVGGTIFAIGMTKSLNPANQVTKHVDLNDKEFSNFDIDLDIADLEFKKSDDGSKKVVLNQSDKYYHTVETKDNTLKIQSVDTRKWYEKWFDFTLSFMKVTIYLPENSYGDLKIDSSTGDVDIPANYTFNSSNIKLSTGKINFKSNVTNKAYFKASTGDVNINDSHVNELEIETSTGNNTLNNVKADENIAIKASTGDVKTNGVKAKNLKVKTSTGKINIIDTIIDEKITLEASTGNITFDRSDANTLDVKTDTGNVKGTILTSKIIFAETDTGRLNYPKLETGGRFDIKTDTGDIDIQILNS